MEQHDSNKKNVSRSIPERVRRLFWDVSKNEVDPERHRVFVIRRIMDFAAPGDMRWMLDTYPGDEIIQVLKKSKGLSRKSVWFWAAHFTISR